MKKTHLTIILLVQELKQSFAVDSSFKQSQLSCSWNSLLSFMFSFPKALRLILTFSLLHFRPEQDKIRRQKEPEWARESQSKPERVWESQRELERARGSQRKQEREPQRTREILSGSLSLSLAFSGSLWHAQPLSSSLLLSEFAYKALARLTSFLLGS